MKLIKTRDPKKKTDLVEEDLTAGESDVEDEVSVGSDFFFHHFFLTGSAIVMAFALLFFHSVIENERKVFDAS